MRGNNGRKEKGSVSVEASIALTAFLFMFIMLYSIITICRAQAEIGIALNSSAKELSQYSYLYGLTGLDKSFRGMYESGRKTTENVNGFIGNINEAFNGIQSLGGKLDGARNSNITNVGELASQWEDLVTGTQDGYAQIQGSVEGVKEKFSNMAEDPKGLLIGLAKVFACGVINEAVSHFIAEPVTKVLMKKHLKRSDTDDPNLHLKSLGVKSEGAGGNSYLDSMDFSSSTLFANGSDTIILVARYQIEMMPLLPIDTTFTITQSAATKGWLHGDGAIPGEKGQGGGGSGNSGGGTGGKGDAEEETNPEKPPEENGGEPLETEPPKPVKVSYSERYTTDEDGNKILKPDIIYQTNNGYTYTTDSQGRIVKVEGSLKNEKGIPDKNAQKQAGGSDRKPDDDGGHLIGLQFGGSGDIDNLVAINSQVKEGGGKWYNMEKEWRAAVDDGKKVEVNISCSYPDGSERPGSFDITYTIEGETKTVTIQNKKGG